MRKPLPWRLDDLMTKEGFKNRMWGKTAKSFVFISLGFYEKKKLVCAFWVSEWRRMPDNCEEYEGNIVSLEMWRFHTGIENYNK